MEVHGNSALAGAAPHGDELHAAALPPALVPEAVFPLAAFPAGWFTEGLIPFDEFADHGFSYDDDVDASFPEDPFPGGECADGDFPEDPFPEPFIGTSCSWTPSAATVLPPVRVHLG
jgi:hypothetical protein